MSPIQNNKTPESKKPVKKVNEALKYSGMGMQLAIAVFLGAMIGKKLDAHFQTEMPIWTALLALVFLGVMMYSVLKDLLK